MNAIHSSLCCKSEQMGVPKSNKCESSNYTNTEHAVFDALQSLRKYVVFCDIRLKADDTIVVLMRLLVNISGLRSLILVKTKNMLQL